MKYLRTLFFIGIFPLLIAAGCETIDPLNVDDAPPIVLGFSVETGPGQLLLRWNYLDEVSPSLSFSGYKVYLQREGWDDGYQAWTSFDSRPGSSSFLPLVKRENSYSESHMEVWIVGLRNGFQHDMYIVGVQNGLEGPASVMLSDVPFKLNVTPIEIREEKQFIADWYIPGYNEAGFSEPAFDRIGYGYDLDDEKHYIRFQSINEGGQLRLQSAGTSGGKMDAPTDDNGTPVGFHTDPDLDRIEIAEGDYIFIQMTNGTEWLADDHYARIYIDNILDIPSNRTILIDCAYQPRANTPNL